METNISIDWSRHAYKYTISATDTCMLDMKYQKLIDAGTQCQNLSNSLTTKICYYNV